MPVVKGVLHCMAMPGWRPGAGLVSCCSTLGMWAVHESGVTANGGCDLPAGLARVVA